MRPYSTLAWVSLESLGQNSYSLSSLRAEKKGEGGILFGALRAWCGSFISQARVCLPIAIEFHLVLSKLPSIHWVVILAIVCLVRCINAIKLRPNKNLIY